MSERPILRPTRRMAANKRTDTASRTVPRKLGQTVYEGPTSSFGSAHQPTTGGRVRPAPRWERKVFRDGEWVSE